MRGGIQWSNRRIFGCKFESEVLLKRMGCCLIVAAVFFFFITLVVAWKGFGDLESMFTHLRRQQTERHEL